MKAGNKLGPYEVRTLLGAGGMGEVYLCRDTKLDRDVALKVLPDAFARDKERVARFRREAKVLASLNHPGIGAIYGFEESDGECCLVLEYVKGETLAARLDRGPLPADEALDVARQIAEALEAAHEIGVIHRDLKPANVMLRADGVVKVLDFGLAKAMAEESSGPTAADSPTITAEYTRPGVVLGTAAYMSPEQARGKPLDKRTDIWSFGVVLFECVSGRRPFKGETTSDLVARILEREPDWTLLPDTTPPLVQLLLRRCLAKDKKRRLRDIGDASVDIESAVDDPSASGLLLAQHALAAHSGRRTRRAALLVAMLAVFGVVMTVAYVNRAATDVRVFRTFIPAPKDTTFVSVGYGPREGGPVTISPDGRLLAFVARDAEGRERLWIRPLDSLTSRPLPNTENAFYPFWSPDSRSIGFFADGKLKRIDAAGGPPLSVCHAPSGRGGTWNAQGVIVFAPTQTGPLHRVSAAGGRSTPVTAFDKAADEDTHRWPFFLPDEHHFLYLLRYTDVTVNRERDSIMLGSLDERVGTRLLATTSNAVYASYHVLFLQEGTLMAQPFDMGRLELAGDVFPVAKQVQYDHSFSHGVFSASTNGVLVYQTGSAAERTQLMWIGRDGTEIGTVGDRANHFAPVISPDGKLAAVVIDDIPSAQADIWIIDLSRGSRTRFTFDSDNDVAPRWSADGNYLMFASDRNGPFDLYRKSVEGLGGEELILQSDRDKYPTGWSPDGQHIIYAVSSATHGQATQSSWDIGMLTLRDERQPTLFLQTSHAEKYAVPSPDGRWIAYQSNDSGRDEVFVTPFPGPGRKWQVSTDGGIHPTWRKDGKELFYISPDSKLMSVEVRPGEASFEIGQVTPLFDVTHRAGGIPYAVDTDGERFLVIKDVMSEASSALTLVINWTADLNKK